VDGVLRIGAVPTTRLFRDLEELRGRVPVLSVAREPFPGLSHGRIEIVSPGRLLAVLPVPSVPGGAAVEFLGVDRVLRTRIDDLLESEPRSEPALVRRLGAIRRAPRLLGTASRARVTSCHVRGAGARIEVSGDERIDGQVHVPGLAGGAGRAGRSGFVRALGT
jgi:2-succinyl-5-enolpyruvyl-6-hydroxy-3-cyclohexene-1-carboxylate synthase